MIFHWLEAMLTERLRRKSTSKRKKIKQKLVQKDGVIKTIIPRPLRPLDHYKNELYLTNWK